MRKDITHPKISIITLGCRANQAESEEILKELDNYKIVKIDEDPDVYILNTCTVTKQADRDVKKFLNKIAKNLNEKKILFITGCYIEANPEIDSHSNYIKTIPNKDKLKIPLLINQFFQQVKNNNTKYIPQKARIPLNIQMGCRHNCSYCIVPFVRGKKESSLSINEIKEKIDYWTERGIKEIVLSGINLGRWGATLNPTLQLADLIYFLENQTLLKRYRLSSIEPWGLNERFIDAILNSKRLAPHLHIPLQHGSDTILKQMHRPYTTEIYSNLINKIISKRDDITIGTDVMVGFPGETKQLFEQSYDFIKNFPFTYLHVFTFSPRKLTQTADLKSSLDQKTIKQWVAQLRQLSVEKRNNKAQEMMNRQIDIIIEKKLYKNVWEGTSDNYFSVIVSLSDEKNWAHSLIKVKIVNYEENGILKGDFLEWIC